MKNYISIYKTFNVIYMNGKYKYINSIFLYFAIE